MSDIEIANRDSAILPSLVYFACLSINTTSIDVPPISSVNNFVWSVFLAIDIAASAPLAGPDNNNRIVYLAAYATGKVIASLCMT